MKGDLPRVTEHFINMKADSSIFTISATGSALPSAPALENRKSEARSRCAQVRWRNRHQNCMHGPPRGHPFHPTTSRWASTTLILCHCSPGVGGRTNKARHTPSFSSTTNPKANLSATIFTCHLPEEETCRRGGIVGGQGRDNCFLSRFDP